MEQQVSLSKIYEELKKIERTMVTRAEINGFVDSVAILSNEDTMNQIKDSEKDIDEGNVKEVSSVEDI